MHRRRYLASVALCLGGTGCLGTPVRTGRTTGDGGDNSTTTPVCPPFDTDANRTICFRTHSDDKPICLSVSHADWTIDTTDNAVETNSFTLHNESDSTLRFDPRSWKLYEQPHNQTSAKWKRVSRQDGTDRASQNSGETYRWSLSRLSHPSPNAEHTDYITADIDTGRYAFVVRVSDPRKNDSIACLAIFSLTLT
jgi:hypothetical protein